MKHINLCIICCVIAIQLCGQTQANELSTNTFGVGGETGIVDLHSHPSLKMYLFNTHIWKKHHSSAGINLFKMQTDTRTLSKKTVKGIIATHYLLERGFVKKSLLNTFLPLLEVIAPSLVVKVENEDYSNFAQINNMLDVLELQIREANIRQSNIKFRLVRNFDEFEKAIKENEIPVAHAIEGAHALGRNMAFSRKRREAQERKQRIGQKITPGAQNEINLSGSQEARLTDDLKQDYKKYKKIKAPAYNSMQVLKEKPETKYIQNLDALSARGVCMMSLSHFLPNDLTKPTEGISPDAKKSFHMEWQYNPSTDDIPLTPVGKKIVERMLQIGMIVDLTHTNPVARNEVFEINKSSNEIRKTEGKPLRPVIFSHAGVQYVFNTGDKKATNKNYGFYNVSDAEIEKIAACRGVIGVIPENFWLKACDKKIKDCQCDCREGIPFILETIRHIHDITGTYENISIGSDFDGLADAPKDLFNPSQYDALIAAMRDTISPEDIARITHTNALRVLKNGWGQ